MKIYIPRPLRFIKERRYRRIWRPGHGWIYGGLRLSDMDSCSRINGIELCKKAPDSYGEVYWYAKYCPKKSLKERWKTLGLLPQGYDCRLISLGNISPAHGTAHIGGFFHEIIDPETDMWVGRGDYEGEFHGDPYVRKSGAGSRVYLKLETWMKQHGVNVVGLEPMNTAAEKFWVAMGYRNRKYYSPPVADVNYFRGDYWKRI